MKIGILTFHNANNYGAVLQAYALQEVLRSKGHDVQIVDYRNHVIEKRKSYFSLKYNSILRVAKRILTNYHGLKKRTKIFQNFRGKYLNISSHEIFKTTLGKSNYDVLIVGSDQVWNPNLTGGVDGVYWGKYSGNIPTISYAASSNDLNQLPQVQQSSIIENVRFLKKIGVREVRLQEYLSKKCKVDSTVVLDPTVLAGKEIFQKIVSERMIPEPYLLVYNVENMNERFKKQTFSLAKERNLRIVVIGDDTFENRHFWGKVSFVTPSVPQFLSLFKYADLVMCISFHGTVFSVLFEREFYSFKGGNMSRVETLLNQLNLSDRIIGNTQSFSRHKIDYSAVSPLLIKSQRESMQFFESFS